MRFLLTILFLLLPAPLLACEGFEHDMSALEHGLRVEPGAAPKTASFGKEFESFDELKRWTENSTFGGGRIERGEFGGRDVAYAYRSYTSGVKSSDAAVYVRDGSVWKLVKAHPIVMNSWIVADAHDGAVVFHPEGQEKSLMTLSGADLAPF